ncbi:MAG: hypothetical protein OXI58_07430 [Gemmatimonadota bacterium]|nr:hypothetical protein [Gemmatimonadota bacterium]
MPLCLLLILALCGMLIQPVQAEPVDSLAVEAESVDSYFLNDRAITRIPTKLGLGALTAVGTGFLSFLVAQPFVEEEPPGSPFPDEPLLPLFFGLLAGYPVGVYLADPVESSFWMTFVGGSGLALGSLILGGWATEFSDHRAEQIGWVVALGSPIMASELSRLLPKRYRNPNPFKWLFGKFRRPSSRVSFGLAPTLNGGLSTSATLHF